MPPPLEGLLKARRQAADALEQRVQQRMAARPPKTPPAGPVLTAGSRFSLPLLDYKDNTLNPLIRVPLALRSLVNDLAESPAGQALSVLQGIVPSFAAGKVPVALRTHFSPEELAAINGTKGATTVLDGLRVPVVRRQPEVMAGSPAARTGVFYLTNPQTSAKHYGVKQNPGFGGDQVIKGSTVFQNPLIVKASGGGKISDATVKALEPEALPLFSPTYRDRKVTAGHRAEELADLADQLGLSGDLVHDAYLRTSRYTAPNYKDPHAIFTMDNEGPLRGYFAAREALVAQLARARGYDGILTNHASRLGEVFDIREAVNPSPSGHFELNPPSMWGARQTPLQQALTRRP